MVLDRLVAGLRLRQFGNSVVTQVMEPESRYPRRFRQLPPSGAPALHRFRRVDVVVLASRKEKVLWLRAVERLRPLSEFADETLRCLTPA